MTKKLAIDKFLGKNGEKRVTCAQTILGAFQEKFDVEDETIDLFAQFGGGRAPEGLCGAYYSTVFLLNEKLPDMVDKFKLEYEEKLKFTKCRDLKANKISCIQCVEFCSEHLENIKK